MTPGDRDREMAREFWRWFRHAPHTECRDSDCDVKLTEAFATARAEGRAEAVAEIVAWLREYAKRPYTNLEKSTATNCADLIERGDHAIPPPAAEAEKAETCVACAVDATDSGAAIDIGHTCAVAEAEKP